ncbi:MAG: pilus assembly protein PilM [Planctomycetes bacterium]|nr:pilus assembly protein PilM [Planctomycetota bacterium]MBL7142638.1 pilus assembly protein PilM [Phycisphaerae bacterium]
MLSWALKSRGLLPIGLDIGHNSIKMIQLLVNGEQLSVIAAQKARIDHDINNELEKNMFIVSAIKQMLAEGRFHGSNVVSSLPNDGLEITSLRLAEAQSDGIEQALRKEVVQRFGLDPDEDAMQYVIAGNVHQGDEIKNELILFAAANETIKSHIELLEQAGLKPVSIDTVPCALFRSFERSQRRQEDRERTVVFVDVGNQFTTVVFGRGGEISFVKQIPLGGEKFNAEIAAKLGVDISEAEMLREALQMEKSFSTSNHDLSEQPVDGNEQKLEATTRQAIVDAVSEVAAELTREISLCLRYYTVTFRGKRVGQAFFTGGGAYEYILLDVLKRQLAVEIEVAQPLKGFDMSRERGNLNFDSDRRGLLCEWAVAVGLSLKGWKITESVDYESSEEIRV